MISDFRDHAVKLARRPYTEFIFQDFTTDDDGSIMFVGITPELPGCIAQGETLREARENLLLVRIDSIEHWLTHQLDVPPPANMIDTFTEATMQQMPIESVQTSPGDDPSEPSFSYLHRHDYGPVHA
ncbi:MAG: type II toxin-antitoxin system HicB family antitoxin [Chloroflexota bacterium]|nr:type II toxin-antitoxin system HicB family antitoxin [Chloroflexota bacterium]